ncbi:helix-turn-helix transcriptional regulator [Pelotomaculum terephthalicicum JT]|uniref:helix-turn-helix transcriptional regulator n=1 Tax=Pelotomaculum TaxID=191373 RepID=UPI0009C70F09|nr:MULTISPECIES: helix-turn-helix transcriptional regulator [Pelotomaculum]MCG9966716.1 helix-turn-helix transcriptional regulator [Pelotomaculum terephthalicicum JT]OPX91426.1 MAG: Serine/threonine-protein kinase PknK [Pelotomaculum sp. PtaB.Bin117]
MTVPKAKEYNTKSLYFPGRITKALDGICSYPLTVIEAPMGYGKTTAVREYLRNAGADTLWQEVPAGGDGFWEGFAGLFREFDSERSQSLIHLRFPDNAKTAREAVKLIRDINLPENTVLLVDDYQNINIPGANGFFEQLAESRIERLHIVLVTRAARFNRLHELALKGVLCHIAKETFEFAPQEIAAYYRACGVHLSESEAARLHTDTEGWISDLYLIMLEYIAKGEYTPTDSINNLIEKAVYNPLPEDAREFLVAMSVFEAFTLKQAAFIWGKNAGMILDGLCENNTFVTYDGRPKVYHIHTLFTEFLNDRLEEKETNYRRKLYAKAARWFMEICDYAAARRFFYECGDFDGLLETLEKDKTVYYSAGSRELFIKYMAECPQEIKARHHYALLVYAMHLFVHKELELFRKTCGELSENIEKDKCLDSAAKNRLLGEFELLQSFAEFNDLKKVSGRYKKAWAYLNQPTSVYDSGINSTFGSPSVLSLYYRESGRLSEHIADLKNAMPYFTRLTSGQGSGAEDVMEAENLFNRGDFDNAAVAAQKALLKARDGRDESIAYAAQYFQTLIDFMKGDLAGVISRINEMQGILDEVADDAFIHTVEICTGCIYAYLDQPGRIPGRLKEFDTASPRLRFPAYPFFNVMYGRLLLIKGEYLKLIGSAEHFISVSSVFSNLLGYISPTSTSRRRTAGYTERMKRWRASKRLSASPCRTNSTCSLPKTPTTSPRCLKPSPRGERTARKSARY